MQRLKVFRTILLSPLSAIYWLITSIRNWCYDIGIFKSSSFDIPIISVGNLAVGGSGKTPMVELLIRKLQDDYSIATLSRGYGRKTKGFLWVQKDLLPSQTGDEPLQIKSKFEDIAVAVCEDRVAGVKKILKEKPQTNLILLDDAFQHRSIKPSIQLLLSTYDKPFYTDWLMPSGRLRESRIGANRADAIVFTKCPPNPENLSWKQKPIFYSKIVYQNPNIEGKVFGFSALADNSVFKNHLEATYNVSGLAGFKDHHSFSKQEVDNLIAKAHGATLVCTEKDWIKVRHLADQKNIKYVSIKNELSGTEDFLSWLKQNIT